MLGRVLVAPLVVALVGTGPVVMRAQAPAAPVVAAATPENASLFLGDWAVTVEGQQGPFTFDLSLKVNAGKVVGEMSSTMTPKQAIADITRSGDALVLRYTFDFQGTAVPTVMTITAVDGKFTAKLAFGDGGAYQMDGSATKKSAQG
jgi:hypothetical protein